MKRGLSYITASAMMMLGLPWLAVTFAPGDAGMAICFLLFFAVDPVYAVMTGVLAGIHVRNMWFQPLVTPLAFLAGVWLMFEVGDPVMHQYALVYLGLGISAMLITLGIRKIAS